MQEAWSDRPLGQIVQPSGPHASSVPSAADPTRVSGERSAQARSRTWQQLVGRLGTGDAVLPVDDEERHAADARAPGPRPRRRGRRRRSSSLVQHLRDLGGVQAGVGREPDQGVAVADRLALGEVGAHEALLDGVLDARGRRRGGSGGGRRRCWSAASGRGGSRAPRRRPAAVTLPIAAWAWATRHAVLRREQRRRGRGPRRRANGRRGRVELEAAPLDLDVVAVREPRQRRLEPTLADVAPRDRRRPTRSRPSHLLLQWLSPEPNPTESAAVPRPVDPPRPRPGSRRSPAA